MLRSQHSSSILAHFVHRTLIDLGVLQGHSRVQKVKLKVLVFLPKNSHLNFKMSIFSWARSRGFCCCCCVFFGGSGGGGGLEKKLKQK